MKVTILLEELLALGHTGAEYDAWLINIGEGDQFGSGFVAVNPNSKIPALLDHRSGPSPSACSSPARSCCTWPRSSARSCQPTRAAAPSACRGCSGRWAARRILGGGFGHFYAYAPVKIEYAINRFAMEVKRQLDVLDRRLAESEYMAGADYTIADMAIWPWYGGLCRRAGLRRGRVPRSARIQQRAALDRLIGARPAVKRGRMVNRVFGEPETAARTPRRQRFRDQDAGQAGAGELRAARGSGMTEEEQDPSVNVFGTPLVPCSNNPLTGFFRDGCCNTSDLDSGSHTVCIDASAEFLAFSRARGNDLSTPRPDSASTACRPVIVVPLRRALARSLPSRQRAEGLSHQHAPACPRDRTPRSAARLRARSQLTS